MKTCIDPQNIVEIDNVYRPISSAFCNSFKPPPAVIRNTKTQAFFRQNMPDGLLLIDTVCGNVHMVALELVHFLQVITSLLSNMENQVKDMKLEVTNFSFRHLECPFYMTESVFFIPLIARMHYILNELLP